MIILRTFDLIFATLVEERRELHVIATLLRLFGYSVKGNRLSRAILKVESISMLLISRRNNIELTRVGIGE